ncbi:hypothetical protein L4C36_08790 [Photobacterium japonica]|uniref:hypothetical protein n=1 Tax=Photobacterium japonica TaxID=2910235 RepID=UPI003D0BC63D
MTKLSPPSVLRTQKLTHALQNTLIATSLLASSFLASSTVNASNFSYNYVEARVPMNPGGIGAAASLQLHPNAYAIVEVESNFDDVWQLKGGLGFNAPISPYADITGQIKLLSVKNEDYDKTLGRSGSELNIGLSGWVLPQIQAGGTVGVIDLNKDFTLVSMFARFHASNAFSFGAEWRIKDIDDHGVMLSARYPF